MAENKKNIEQKKQPIEEHKYTISSFVEESPNIRKRIDGGFAFKTWYKLKKNGTFNDRKSMKSWESLLNKFLNEPVK